MSKVHIIDNCCKNDDMGKNQYEEIINKELQNLHNVQNTISKMELIKDI